jgi:hypothetical protein
MSTFLFRRRIATCVHFSGWDTKNARTGGPNGHVISGVTTTTMEVTTGGGDNGGGDNGEGDHTPESRALIGQLAPAHFTFHTIVNAMQFCF